MKFLLVISCAFALAAADVSKLLKEGGFSVGGGFDGGASYDSYDDAGSDGGSSYSGGSSYTADTSFGSSGSGDSGSARFGSFSSGGGNSFSSGGGSSFSSGGGSSFSGGSSGGDAGYSGGSGQLETGRSGFLDYSSGGGSSSGGGKIVKPVIKHGAPIVSKAFFVHEAPAEEPQAGPNVELKETVVRPRKHYNIVFVKTPVGGAGGSISSNNVNVFPENEEKTIVYVLSGRADGLSVDSNGEVQLPQPKAPSKPEVVFVKYNSEADAQRAISDIQGQYNNQQGASVSVVGGSGSAGGHSGYHGGRSGVSGGSGGSSGSFSSGSSSHSGSSHSSGGGSYTQETESKPIRSVRYRREPFKAPVAAATSFQIQKSKELAARKH